MSDVQKRKINRLKNYDYHLPGYYFITVCTANKKKILWQELSDRISLSKSGEVVDMCIRGIAEHYPFARVDKYVIMPNHVHIILQILPNETGKTVAFIVGHMKQAVSTILGESIWQKGYHDHVIRNEHEYQKIWMYIDYNPTKWTEDCYYC